MPTSRPGSRSKSAQAAKRLGRTGVGAKVRSKSASRAGPTGGRSALSKTVGRHAGLAEYKKKRHFDVTSEPAAKVRKTPTGRSYVIQKHDASRLHYDFRLEHHGVLMSWAVPKGPSLDPAERVLAVQVEDHPVDYGTFEGVIPQGQYGGGTVMLWDRGTWEPLGDVDEAMRVGKLKFKLRGEKLQGGWMLVRMRGERYGKEGKNWLLIKERDDAVVRHADGDVREDEPLSVKSGREMQEIADAADDVWQSKPAKTVSKTRSRITQRVARNRASKKAAVTEKTPKGKVVAQEESEEETVEPARLPGAFVAEFRPIPTPELATLVDEAPAGDEWLHEIKFDGYRILALLDKSSVKLVTRRGNDWTDRFGAVAEGVRSLGAESLVLDGEVVVLSEEGRSDFQALQNVLTGLRKRALLLYFVFDLLYWDGFDLARVPLTLRKRALRHLLVSLPAESSLRYSDHILGHGPKVFSQACDAGMEGIISKRANSAYVSKRTKDWVKVKCGNRQEFVIGGYTDPSGSRKGFGALLLGYFNGMGELIYCGRVGTGFNGRTLASTLREMTRRETDCPPFKNPPRGRDAAGVHWLKPELVGEVQFSGWTGDGILRHSSFHGLREDKAAREVVRESANRGQVEDGEEGMMKRTPRMTGSPKGATAPGRSAGKDATRSRMSNAPPGKGPGSQARAGARRNANAHAGVREVLQMVEGPVAGVTLTNPQRMQYPESGVTKLELARYYESVRDWVLPHMVRRPLSLVRCPQGIGKYCFYQKHLTDMLPKSVHGVPVREKNGVEEYVAIENLTGLIGLVQLGVLEIHPWGSREDDVEHPDRLVVDLDPGPGVEWGEVVEGARLVRERLGDLGLESFVKTTGGKGLHVVFPIQRRADWDEAKAFTRAIAEAVVRDHPDRYLAVMTKAKRTGKIFIDYLRNGRGATAIAPYSTRARENATVATPLSWEELGEQTLPAQFTVRTVPQRVARLKHDPWAEIGQVRQSITASMMKKLGLR